MRYTLAICCILLLTSAVAWACPNFDFNPSNPISKKLAPNALQFELFDRNGDGKRDYALVYQTNCKDGLGPNRRCEMPLFIMDGDDVGPSKVWVDKRGFGRCDDIALYWKKGQTLPSFLMGMQRNKWGREL